MTNCSNIPGSARVQTGMRLLRAVLAGLLAAALGLAGVCAMLPAQTAYDPARLYDYVYSGTKSQSGPFTTASMSDDGHLAFGSSEFFISKDKVAQCPQAVLGENVTGVDLTYVGEAYDQSLWQAIAAGAYAGEAKNKKVMIVSPQWSPSRNGDQGKFASKFSYELYRRFANNPSISDETKAYVRSRVEPLGVDAKTTAAANRDTAARRSERRGSRGSPTTCARAAGFRGMNQAPLKSAVRAAGRAPPASPTGTRCSRKPMHRATPPAPRTTTASTTRTGRRTPGYHVERGQTFSQADESTPISPASSRCAARRGSSRS